MMARCISFLVVSIFLAGVSYANIQADFSSSYSEVVNSQTLRIKHISNIIVDGKSIDGDLWVDVQWDPQNLAFKPTVGGLDGVSVVGNWVFAPSTSCLAGAPFYLTLNANRTISCTVDDTGECKNLGFMVAGTWELSGAVLTLNISNWNTLAVPSNSILVGTLNGAVHYNGIQDGIMLQRDINTQAYTVNSGCFTATRVTQ
jgi:hypothetical protein